MTLFSAMLQEEALTIAQVRAPEGANETTQVKALVEETGIRDGEKVLAALDAAHCNKETAELIGGKPGWDYLITVKTGLAGEKISKDTAIQVTSAAGEEMSAADISKHTREHWGIENKSHYIRDTVFREDHNQSWKGNGPRARSRRSGTLQPDYSG